MGVVCGIYKIQNTENGRMYIGQSKDVRSRFNSHRLELCKNKHHNRYLQAAWNKYGASSFEFSLVEECPLEILDERETYWISKLNTHNDGYNLDFGGKGTRGYIHTPEQRQKKSERSRGRVLSEETKNHMRKPHVCTRGVNHPLYGLKWADRFPDDRQNEIRAKISTKLSGKNNPRYGVKVSNDIAKRISDSNKRHYEIFGSPLKGRRFPERRGGKSPSSVRVICLNTGEIFCSITEATEKYPQANNISRCCSGEISYSGKDAHGVGLVWRYMPGFGTTLEGDDRCVQ